MTAAPAGPEANTADLDAARLVLARMGLSPHDLLTSPVNRAPMPTFAEYIPIVAAAVSDGARRVYGSYWNRILEQWANKRLDEPTPSQIKHLVEQVKLTRVTRRNARGGRSAGEHLIAALRCVYRHAEHDGLIAAADNPALKVAKPRRLPSTRRAVADTLLAEINQAAATTGNDPALDTLLLRLHVETACRRGGALALRLAVQSPALRPGPAVGAGRRPIRRVRWVTRMDALCATEVKSVYGALCATAATRRSPGRRCRSRRTSTSRSMRSRSPRKPRWRLSETGDRREDRDMRRAARRVCRASRCADLGEEALVNGLIAASGSA